MPDIMGGIRRKLKFFDLIKPGTFMTLLFWWVISAAAAFLFSYRVCGVVGAEADASLAGALAAVAVTAVYAAVIVHKEISSLKLIIDEDGEVMTNIVGGTMISCNDDFFTIKKCTDRFYSMTGYRFGEIARRYRGEFSKMLVGDESRGEFARLKRRLRETGSGQVRYKLLRGDGTDMWVACSSFLTKDRGGNSVVYSVFLDITEEMNLQQKYALAEARNKIVFENINSGIFEWDMIRGTIDISDHMERRFIGAVKDGPIPALNVKNYIEPEDYEHLIEKIESVKNGDSDKIVMTLGLKNADGTVTHSDMSLVAIRDHNYVAVRMVGILIDVEERHRREEELRSKASRDSLTGLYNKGATQQLIENTLELRGNQEHAVVLCDIDDFKSVNDTFGHGVGDEAVKMIARLLSETFDRGCVIGRTGGDEFMVLCRNIGGDYYRLRKQIRRLNENRPTIEEGGLRRELTLSIGVALYPNGGRTYDELYKNADTALYKVKERGKAGYEVYTGY